MTTATGDTFTPTALSTLATSTNTATTTSSSSTPSASSTAAPASMQNHSALSTGAIVGIVVGGLVVALLVGVVFYMCGRQRTVNDLLRQQQIVANGPNKDAYQPSSPGVSEVYYSSMLKPAEHNNMRFSGQSYNPSEFADTSSYRSGSPPIDERTGMIANTMGIATPASGHPNSTYYDEHGREVPYAVAGFR
jgi:hypothetical protein